MCICNIEYVYTYQFNITCCLVDILPGGVIVDEASLYLQQVS